MPTPPSDAPPPAPGPDSPTPDLPDPASSAVVIVHGIANCDQVRATMGWLRRHGIAARLHDVRRDGLTREQLERWITRMPWDALINRRGLTWRQLPLEQRNGIVDRVSGIEALIAHPLLLRRPVIEHDGTLLVGHSEERLAGLFRPTLPENDPEH